MFANQTNNTKLKIDYAKRVLFEKIELEKFQKDK